MTGPGASTDGVAFYCVASARYFPGAVAMINSLRLIGHREPIHVLGWGLTPAQAELLSQQATVVQAPPGREPFTLKPFLPLRDPTDVMVLIDTDMIVTRPLDPLIEAASRGSVVAFRDHADRFRPEWGPMLDLEPLRRQPYLCSGLVAMGRSSGEGVLRAIEDLQARVDYERSYFGRHDTSYPLLYADQDVLNAILASQVESERIVALEHRLAPMTPFEGLEVIDSKTLRCEYRDGTQPYLLHHSLAPKPWEAHGGEGPYTGLLRRLLAGPDVALRMPRRAIPSTLRSRRLAGVRRAGAKARERVRFALKP
jgi:hypothetical protein